MSENVIVVTESNWHGEVIESDRPVRIDFWALRFVEEAVAAPAESDGGQA